MKSDSRMKQGSISNSVTVSSMFVPIALIPITKKNFCPKSCCFVSYGDWVSPKK